MKRFPLLLVSLWLSLVAISAFAAASKAPAIHLPAIEGEVDHARLEGRAGRREFPGTSQGSVLPEGGKLLGVGADREHQVVVPQSDRDREGLRVDPGVELRVRGCSFSHRYGIPLATGEVGGLASTRL